MKQLLLMLAVIAFAASLPAQNTMQVKRITGNDASFPLAPLGPVTFTATDMVVGGPNVSIPMADISKIFFSDVAAKASRDVTSNSVAQKDVSVAASASQFLVSFTLNQPGRATITVSNSMGKVVNTILNASRNAGMHTVAWNKDTQGGNPVPAGIYVIQAVLNGKQVTTKQLVIQ